MDAASDNDLAKLQQRVSQYPTDLQARFELGVALYSRQEYNAAIAELQNAMDHPVIRLRAMRLLIDTFEANGMLELADRMRKQLARESGDNDESGSAPVPSPTRPVLPPGPLQAGNHPDKDEPQSS